LFIAGAGFDSRSTRIAEVIPEEARKKGRALLLREERPDPRPELIALACSNRDRLRELIPNSYEHKVPVFADDNAVVGGRNGALLVQDFPLDGVTDIFVDISALSIGVAFPIIKCLMDSLQSTPSIKCNLHVVCCDSPQADMAISSVPTDVPTPVHGFRGGWGLDEKSQAAVLWMPQLCHGKRANLSRIFQMLQDTQPETVVCPILPFPSSRPRLADELIEEYAEELQAPWSVDVRDLVYADEKNPLDLYRTILRIADARHRVFESVGGSQIVLSPLSNKALSLGALMAALERKFTILYVESISYALDVDKSKTASETSELVHIWLHGDAYAGELSEGERADAKAFES
jgi:hypothetical protein